MMFIIIIIALVILFIYAILKEREELGCYRVSIKRQCIDENSVYIKGTKLEETDNCDTMFKKLLSILSYHEKAGIWKRTLIISGICVIFIFIVYKINNNFENKYSYIVLLLVIFSIMYFYHNYINYHHFRLLKNNGKEIIEMINNKCIKH